ncbi:AEC family transporter [Lysobacter sp. TAF61]|uniref:AEC family transporter n=1 Tax=Lysobacter sp. TAF61 TaxID=3233072 RepID=UPI003F9915EE
MIEVIEAVFPIFLLIVAGAITKRCFIGSDDFWSTADKLVYYLLFPSLLVLDVSGARFLGGEAFPGVVAAIGATTFVALIAFAVQAITSLPNSVFTSIFQGAVRYNSYVFIALSQSLFGEDGVAISGVFVAYMIVLTNVMSVMVLNRYGTDGRRSIANMLGALIRNPLIGGALLGVVLNVCDVKIPEILAQLLRYLGGAATPLSLMSVGAGLIFVTQVRKIAITVYSSGLKLLVMPAITLALLKFQGVAGVSGNVALLYAAAPCAGNAYILARQMGGDAEAMASIITWTTVGSVVTITLILSLVTL